MSAPAASLNNRVFYLDLLRAIGCLSVVLLHVSSNFTLEIYGSINYWIGVIFDAAARFSVPLFVMISGALFLNEDYAFTKQKFRQHIIRLVRFFFGWSVIYCIVFKVFKNFLTGTRTSLLDVIVGCINGPFHLWFIPMIIGLYLITPFLRLWIKKENKNTVKQFLLLGFFFNIVFPLAEFFIGSFHSHLSEISSLVANLNFHYGRGYVFYFVLGWYLHQFDTSYIRPIFCGGILGLIITIFGTVYFTGMDMDGGYFFNYFSVSVFFSTIAVFVCVKSAFQNKEVSSGFVYLICHHSMGIYAMHIAVFPLFTYILKIKHAAWAIPIYFLIAVVLPITGSVILKRIKFLRFLC